jgi:hypothetical protein
MSVSLKKFTDNISTFAKTGVLAAMALTATSCGGDDPVGPQEPGSGGTGAGKVYSINDEITGMTLNMADSTISIRTGGYDTPAEILLSAKKNAVGGKVNLDAPLLSEDNLVRDVGRNGLLKFKDRNKALTVSSAEEGKKNIGYGTNNNDKIDVLASKGMSALAAMIEAGDGDTYQVTQEQIVMLFKQSWKVIGAEAKGIGGNAPNGTVKTYKIALN